ncbi:hypothetical protein K523DRAFT_368238 [Schizophyllum commune Tattone D]|nr:hypothetical protein K523DRAFT_368238 [Schizophyllum commune Tattone D]
MASTAPDVHVYSASNPSTVSLGIPAAYSEEDLLYPDDPAGDEDTEEDLPEEELRRIYDDEEVERFLHLFSTYVTEVRLTAPPTEALSEPNRQATSSSLGSASTSEGGEWVDIRNDVPPPLPPRRPKRADTLAEEYYQSVSLSEFIANRYIVPLLPEEPVVPPAFTLGRFRLTVQRLFLAVRPIYLPFLTRLYRLATWKDPGRSLAFCLLFWFLWLQDLLLPALILRILYALVRRRIFPYPTLEELRERRQEVQRADIFSAEVSKSLTASSRSGVKEVWRLFRVYNKTRKELLKSKSPSGHSGEGKEHGHGKSRSVTDLLGEVSGRTSGGAAAEVVEQADLADANEMVADETPEEQDLKRLGLHILSDIADLHERVKNLFIWRRPEASYRYGVLLVLLFVFTLVVPTKYIVKAVYACLGFLFWHVIPVIDAMSIRDRQRMPPILADVPTDADFAMELISKRVAAGQDLRRSHHKVKKAKHAAFSRSEVSLASPSPRARGSPDPSHDKEQKASGVDWQKWGQRAAIGKAWAEDPKRLFAKKAGDLGWPPSPAVVPGPPLAVAQPEAELETHAYPAHHSTGPGLLTISPVVLQFTPFLSTTPKLSIPIKDLRGVKKTGLLKGLTLRYDDGSQVREEKFPWVGGREELFARLIGPDRTRWLKPLQ